MSNLIFGALSAAIVGLPGTPSQRFSRVGGYCGIGLAVALIISLHSSTATGAVVLIAGAIGGVIAYHRSILEGTRFWCSSAVATCAGFGLIDIGLAAALIGAIVLALPIIHIRRPTRKYV